MKAILTHGIYIYMCVCVCVCVCACDVSEYMHIYNKQQISTDYCRFNHENYKSNIFTYSTFEKYTRCVC